MNGRSRGTRSHVQNCIGLQPAYLGFCNEGSLTFVLVNSQRVAEVHKYKIGDARIAKPQLDGPDTDESLYL